MKTLDQYITRLGADGPAWWSRDGHDRVLDALGPLAPQMTRDRGDLVREIQAGLVVGHEEDVIERRGREDDEGERMTGERFDGLE